MEIIVPDMGHGNCVGIFVKDASLLVDCGVQNKKKALNFRFIQSNLNNSSTKDLAITHYHYDHYNLLKKFPDKFFDNIYLPALPPESSTAQVILEFLSLASVMHYKGYAAIGDIIRVAKNNIITLTSKDCFYSLNKKWEVLWPDYNIIDRRNIITIQQIREKINEIKNKLKKMNPKFLEEFEYWYEIFSTYFNDKREKPIADEIEREKRRKYNISPQIKNSLEEIEKTFKSLVDRSSLVFQKINHDLLFTGDIDKIILDHELNFGNNNYFLIEAPHHGTRYGKAFDKISTEILLISRKRSDNIATGFLKKLPWRILVDTARTGNCIINRRLHHKEMQFISIEDDKASAYFAFQLL